MILDGFSNLEFSSMNAYMKFLVQGSPVFCYGNIHKFVNHQRRYAFPDDAVVKNLPANQFLGWEDPLE